MEPTVSETGSPSRSNTAELVVDGAADPPGRVLPERWYGLWGARGEYLRFVPFPVMFLSKDFEVTTVLKLLRSEGPLLSEAGYP